MKSRTPSRLAVAALLSVASLPAFAQEGPAGGGDTPPAAPPAGPEASGDEPAAPAAKDELHAVWDELRAARDEVRTAQTEGRAAQQAKDRAKTDAAIARATRAQNRMTALAPRFKEAFAATDWRKLDPEADEELLVQGLQMLLHEAIDETRDGKRAVEICEAFLTILPHTEAAKVVAADRMADALLLAGDVDRAMAVWEKGAESQDRGLQCNALIQLGDARAAKGDLEGARAAWRKLRDLPAGGDRADPVSRFRVHAEQRDALVGNAAPGIDAKEWLGAEAKPLSAFRGKVVVIDFWATWCPPCRQIMPKLDALARANAESGLVVLGITTYSKKGFLPNAGTKDLVRDGTAVRPIAEADFPAHVRQFRENSGISYPFVMGAPADFEAYKVIGIPTMVVVDREGKVAFVRSGPGDDTLLRMAVDRALAAPAPSDAPAATPQK